MSSSVCPNSLAQVEDTVDSGTVCRFDPRTDPRWAELVERHPKASVFHSPAWLEALFRTYGYRSCAWTTSPEGMPLRNGLLFCSIESWLTGRRLVSLPFSDHCEPLIDPEKDLPAFAKALENEIQKGRWRYIEIRPLETFRLVTSLRCSTVCYHFHQLDLKPDLATLFGRFQKDSIQRKIRRAERERLRYEEGSTEALLDQFYRIFKATRARHSVPPPPRRWFRNLMDCFGEALKIRVAYKDEQTVAAMITLRHKDTLIYKYGGSDSRFSRFGGVHLLYWQSIQDAKTAGLRYFDLGRTDAGQDGLVTFKNRWGATQSTLCYLRYVSSESATHAFDLYARSWKSRAAKVVLAHLHPSVLSMIGSFLYKHVG
jgi:CelD/BcsL family acetyltransferase involved in cellulose biosynthesis